MNFLILLLLVLGLCVTNTFAFFCPTNFNQIDFGDTLEKVTSLCGKPDKQQGSIETNEDAVPQEWIYYIPQTVTTQAMVSIPGTLKTSITFDETGVAINISVNGIGVGSTTICPNTIQLGNTQEQVKAACGRPNFINRQAPEGPQQQTIVSTLIYNSTPPVSLIFKNGKLTDKQ